MPYSYSNRPDRGWLGSYPTPQDALMAGRNRLANPPKVFVAEFEQSYCSDWLPSIEILISMMRESVSERMGDEYADWFDTLTQKQRKRLSEFLADAMAEWEADLPEESQFNGLVVKTIVGYERLDEVRKADFA